MTSPYDNAILIDSPLAYYAPNATSGTGATDSSGHSNNGTLTDVSAYSQVGAVPNDTDTAILFQPSGGLIFPNNLAPYNFSAITIEFLINLGNGWHYVATTMDNSDGTTFLYLDDTVSSPGRDNAYVDPFLEATAAYAGSFIAPGLLQKVAFYGYRLSRKRIAAHREVFNEAVQNPIQQVLLVNPGYIGGFPGNFPGNEYATVNRTTQQIIATLPLPRDY